MPHGLRLQLSGISKRFGAVQALAGVNLDLRGGEIHGLLGENGAGKSTLMNVLYGLTQPDSGEIRLAGRVIRPRDPAAARRLGIAMVHQHFTVISQLTTAENLALSVENGGFAFRPPAAAARVARLAARFGLDVGRPSTLSGELSIGVRQRLEILKALAGEARVLILDEPTAVLTPPEVVQLFEVLRGLRAEGRLVVFITHKLQEVRAVADRVSVLRRGRVVGGGAPASLSDDELATLMVGGAADERAPRLRSPAAELLQFDMVLVRGAAAIRLGVRAGEVLGIVGADGNGQVELFEILAGLRAPVQGRLRVGGREVQRFRPAALQAAGVGVIPPDRRLDGLVADMSVRENLVLSAVLLSRLSRRGVLQAERIRQFAREEAERYQVRASALEERAGTLSGGNQQRVVVARALAAEPKVLVAVNPTRGLDIAAARAVCRALGEFAAAGRAVLLVSTDLDEALGVSDRIGVLFRHRLSRLLDPPYSLERIGLLMAGVGEA
jgi:simple sugar transport system ATP-binding protein